MKTIATYLIAVVMIAAPAVADEVADEIRALRLQLQAAEKERAEDERLRHYSDQKWSAIEGMKRSIESDAIEYQLRGMNQSLGGINRSLDR